MWKNKYAAVSFLRGKHAQMGKAQGAWRGCGLFRLRLTVLYLAQLIPTNRIAREKSPLFLSGSWPNLASPR